MSCCEKNEERYCLFFFYDDSQYLIALGRSTLSIVLHGRIIKLIVLDLFSFVLACVEIIKYFGDVFISCREFKVNSWLDLSEKSLHLPGLWLETKCIILRLLKRLLNSKKIIELRQTINCINDKKDHGRKHCFNLQNRPKLTKDYKAAKVSNRCQR